MNDIQNEIKYFPQELDNACLDVGKFIEFWGFKEIEGRVWSHILLSNESLCAQDLMARTGVSKGLISLSLARLIEYDVIKLDCIKGKKTQYYQVNENVTDVIKSVLRGREKVLLADIFSSVDCLFDLPGNELKHVNLKRLNFLIKMIKVGQKTLDFIIFAKGKIPSFSFGNAPKI